MLISIFPYLYVCFYQNIIKPIIDYSKCSIYNIKKIDVYVSFKYDIFFYYYLKYFCKIYSRMSVFNIKYILRARVRVCQWRKISLLTTKFAQVIWSSVLRRSSAISVLSVYQQNTLQSTVNSLPIQNRGLKLMVSTGDPGKWAGFHKHEWVGMPVPVRVHRLLSADIGTDACPGGVEFYRWTRQQYPPTPSCLSLSQSAIHRRSSWVVHFRCNARQNI